MSIFKLIEQHNQLGDFIFKLIGQHNQFGDLTFIIRIFNARSSVTLNQGLFV